MGKTRWGWPQRPSPLSPMLRRVGHSPGMTARSRSTSSLRPALWQAQYWKYIKGRFTFKKISFSKCSIVSLGWPKLPFSVWVLNSFSEVTVLGGQPRKRMASVDSAGQDERFRFQ